MSAGTWLLFHSFKEYMADVTATNGTDFVIQIPPTGVFQAT